MTHHKVVVRSLPIMAQVAKKGAKKALEADRARLQKFLALHTPHGPARSEDVVQKHVLAKKPFASAAQPSIDVTDAGVTYTMQCKIGTGTYNLL